LIASGFVHSLALFDAFGDDAAFAVHLRVQHLARSAIRKFLCRWTFTLTKTFVVTHRLGQHFTRCADSRRAPAGIHSHDESWFATGHRDFGAFLDAARHHAATKVHVRVQHLAVSAVLQSTNPLTRFLLTHSDGASVVVGFVDDIVAFPVA